MFCRRWSVTIQQWAHLHKPMEYENTTAYICVSKEKIIPYDLLTGSKAEIVATIEASHGGSLLPRWPATANLTFHASYSRIKRETEVFGTVFISTAPLKISGPLLNVDIYWSVTVNVVGQMQTFAITSKMTAMEIRRAILSELELSVEDFDIICPQTRSNPILSIYSPIRNPWEVVCVRAAYSSLRLEQILPRINFPNVLPDINIGSKRKQNPVSLAGFLNGTLPCTKRVCRPPLPLCCEKWNEGVDAAHMFMKKVYASASAHQGLFNEAPKRTLVDQVLIHAVGALVPARPWAMEHYIYCNTELPTTTVGWGPFDYYLPNATIVEATEEEADAVVSEQDTINPLMTPPPPFKLVHQHKEATSSVEVKQRPTFNDAALAQAIGKTQFEYVRALE